MKKILLLLLFIVPFAANAQSYILTKKTVLDKFDDVLLERDQKTIVSKTDSTFVIEEKGRKPVTYRILNYADFNSMGDKENIVNLVDNVYGYQECWAVILESDAQGYFTEYTSLILETDKEKLQKGIEKLIERFCYYITRRVVTTQSVNYILGQHIWIQKGDNNGRTIYSRM